MTPPDKPTPAPEPEAKISQEAREAAKTIFSAELPFEYAPRKTVMVHHNANSAAPIIQRAIDAATRELREENERLKNKIEDIVLHPLTVEGQNRLAAAVLERDAARAMVVELRIELQREQEAWRVLADSDEGTGGMQDAVVRIGRLISKTAADYARLTVVSRERFERIERNLGDFVVRSEALVEFVRDPNTLLESDPTEVLVDVDRLSRVARSLLIAEPASARAKEGTT
jgi:hypothetical protein